MDQKKKKSKEIVPTKDKDKEKEKRIEKATLETLSENVLPTCHPSQVIKAAREEAKELGKGSHSCAADSNVFKAISLAEFSNGVLISLCFPDEEKTFVIQLSLRFQEEFHCTTESQKATAELVAVNYGRVLRLQRVLNSYLAKYDYDPDITKRIQVLSAELDRAQRHYLASLQTLQQANQPPLNFSLKAQQNNVFQQFIQEERKRYGFDKEVHDEEIIEAK